MRGFLSPSINRIVLLLIAGLVFLSLYPINRSIPKENHWHSILIRSPERLSETESFLKKKGMTEIKSSHLSVYYSDFQILKEIPLNQLASRLLKEDRRFDPVLRKISELFILSGGERIFFKSNDSPYEMILALRGADKGIIWEQSGGVIFVIGPLIYSLLGIVIIFFYKKKCFFPFLIFLSWCPFLFFSGYQWGIIVTPLVLVEIFMFNGNRNLKFNLPAFSALMLIAVISISISKKISFFLQIILTLILVFSLKYSIATKKEYSLNRRKIKRKIFQSNKQTEHNLFEPVFFNKERSLKWHSLSTRSERYFIFLLLPFLFLLLIPFPQKGSNHLKAPYPEEINHHLIYQRDILYQKDWNSQNIANEYTWDRASGQIIQTPLIREKDQISLPSYDSHFVYSFLLNSFLLEESLGFSGEQLFYKYTIFSIMMLFFLHTIIFLAKENEGKDRLFFISNRRGRKVA
jgi:hypothetical protein